MGFHVSPEEVDLLMNYWKWIGKLMGIATSYWPENSKEAFELEKLIRKRHLRKSDAGNQLITALINYYKSTIPDQLILTQLIPILNFFLGKEASKALGIYTKQTVSGELLGLVFKFSGWNNFGSKKSYAQIAKQFEDNQKASFGRKLEINLPTMNRS